MLITTKISPKKFTAKNLISLTTLETTKTNKQTNTSLTILYVINTRKSVKLNASSVDLCYLEYPEKMNTMSEETEEDRPRVLRWQS